MTFVKIKPLSRSFSWTIYFSSQVSIRSRNRSYKFLRYRTVHTSKPRNLWISSSWRGTHLRNSFIMKLFLKVSDIIEILTRIMWKISLIFWRVIIPTIGFTCWLLIADGRFVPCWSARLVFPLRNLCNQRPMILYEFFTPSPDNVWQFKKYDEKAQTHAKSLTHLFIHVTD